MIENNEDAINKLCPHGIELQEIDSSVRFYSYYEFGEAMQFAVTFGGVVNVKSKTIAI